MNINQLESFKLSDAVSFHDKLNPKLFVNNKPRIEVKKQLLLIAKDFISELGIKDLDILDITISGSNAAYTYTPHSDLDLHILVNFKKLSNDEVYQELFNAKKTLYNDSHDITVKGVPVELYIQDSNQPVVSLGEYSLLQNKWLRIPVKRRANLDQTITKQKFSKLLDLVQIALKSKNVKKVEELLKTMRRYRQAGLDQGGEFSPENLSYKALRSQGWLTKLYKLRDDLHSKSLSIEGMYEHLDVKTLSPEQLSKHHNVSIKHLLQQLDKGIKVELEHTNDKKVAKEIALDHLKEDPNYYTKLLKANLEESSYVCSIKDYFFDYDFDNQIKDFILSNTPKSMTLSCQNESMLWFRILKKAGYDVEIHDGFYYPHSNYDDAEGHTWLEVEGSIFDPTAGQFDDAGKGEYETLEVKEEIYEASGYIPSESEKNDPRYKTALTVDIKPNTMKQNAKKLGWNISRAGIPPLLRK